VEAQLRRTATLVLAGLTLTAAVGGSCGGGTGDGGSTPVRELRSPLKECFIFGQPFPPGFAFVPGRNDLVWAVDLTGPTLIPLDVSGERPVVAAAPPPLVIPADSDGDGTPEGFFSSPSPIPDDIEIPRPDLGLVTASGYEEVIFVDPAAGTLRSFDVSVPAGFAPDDYAKLPAPGAPAEPRTAISTQACVRPPPTALDSRGDPIATSIPSAPCDATTPSYKAGFTSGVALIENRLFVSTSNLGAAGEEPQFLPGSVLVYDVDLGTSPPRVSPNATTPVILTTAFNPTHATAYASGGRSFVLVSVSGAIGIEEDDPSTTPVEAAGVVLSDSAIDVIDAVTLELVATIPLGRAGLDFDRLAIDPTGRVAAVGSAVTRRVFAVDLAPLPSLPTSTASPVVLTESVIFDAADAFAIPPAPNGAPSETCAGQIAGYDFNEAGDALFVNDFCDGTSARIDVDLSGSPPVPVPQGRFTFGELFLQTAPLRSDTLGQPRGPGPLEIRPGVPGVDYTGAEFFSLVGEPGLLCAIDSDTL
jgi:hypothetical protein